MTKGVVCPPFCIDREDKISKQALTKFVYCCIKKPSLIVCAPSVKLGAGPSVWGLPGSSIAHVVKVVRSVRAGCMARRPPSGV